MYYRLLAALSLLPSLRLASLNWAAAALYCTAVVPPAGFVLAFGVTLPPALAVWIVFAFAGVFWLMLFQAPGAVFMLATRRWGGSYRVHLRSLGGLAFLFALTLPVVLPVPGRILD